MSKIKKGFAVLGVASAMLVAGPALAQDQGWYAGLTLGQSKQKDACDGVSGAGISCDDKDTAWRILGGYQFNKNLAAELGYTDAGEVSASGTFSASIEAKIWELVAVGSWPFTPNFSAYGKLGMYRADTDFSTNNPAFANESESNTDLTYGIGVRWDFTKNLGARAEYQIYKDVGGGNIGEGDVDVISVGVIWKF
ncbi:MAG TPA: outer membrane beta-barrel protein [Burkholderiales bacterium]|jgi:OOP family OmpA-OmpF porin